MPQPRVVRVVQDVNLLHSTEASDVRLAGGGTRLQDV